MFKKLKKAIKLLILKSYVGSMLALYTDDNDKDFAKLRYLYDSMKINSNNTQKDSINNASDKNNIKNIRWQITNLNYKMDLFMDYFLDPSTANPATGALDLFQKEMLNILLLFKSIVDKHNLRYWLDYGTLLGAVRHGGFIPWDSDVDVSVLEDDLQRLIEILNEELPEEYEFIAFWLDRVYRIRKKDEKSQVFVDVYPYIIYGRDDDDNYKIRMRHGGDTPKVKTYRPHRPFPSSILFPLSDVSFCGQKFKAPKDIDTYLKLKYGNYHLLPKSPHNEPGHVIPTEDIIFYPNDYN